MRILGTLFALTFGLIFASVGMFIALETVVPTYRSWQDVQSWRSTRAELISVSGSENSTEANYRYKVAGVEYQNDRVYLAAFNDNIGSYHQDLYRKLKQLKDDKQPVAIWYDPQKPARSVIDREMRWGLFTLMTGFCSALILIGLGSCYAGFRGKSVDSNPRPKRSLASFREEWKQAKNQRNENFFEFVQRKGEEIQQQRVTQTMSSAVSAGAQPWLNKKEWRNNRIRSNAKTGLYFIWVFAIVWNAISSPILFVLEDEINQQNYAALFGLLFPLVGVILLVVAWKMTRAWRRFGVIELELDPFPGSIGGHVGGSLHLTKLRDSRSAFKVELECVYSYVSGSGDDRSTRETIKWAEQGLAKTESTGRGYSVPSNGQTKRPSSANVLYLRGAPQYCWREGR